MSLNLLLKDDADVQDASDADHGNFFVSPTYQLKVKDDAGVVHTTTAVLADGDYGSVTVSVGGTVITIDNGAVTNAMLADATLQALGAYNTNGLLTQTAADTFTGRTITGTASEITVTNGSGVAGNPTLSLPAALDFTGKTISNAALTNAAITLSSVTNTAIDSTNVITAMDSTFHVVDNGDITKRVAFEVSGVTTATTRTLTVPNTSGTIALAADLASYQPLDSDLTTIAGLTATTDNFIQSVSSAWASRTPAQAAVGLQGTGLDVDACGFRGIPQNSQSGNYTTVAADAGKHLYHASGAGAGDTYTIDSNANVAYEIGTAITFVNMDSNTLAIAITSDTLYLAGTGTTGSRTLAQYGVATAVKLTSTTWVISGTGLT